MEYGPGSSRDIEPGRELLRAYGWEPHRMEAGDPFVARDASGEVVGWLRLVDCPPDGVFVADVMVSEDLRGHGVGTELMSVAMASRPGPYYLVCHPERIAFYERLGYDDVPKETWPPEIVACARAEEDWESGHDELHHFMVRPEG